MAQINKEIIIGADIRTRLMTGVSAVANAVKVTLGPKGRHVILEKPDGLPVITKDGVSVANEITLEDKFENMGAQLVRDVASRANEEGGDGTTTATVLAQAIARRGIRLVENGCDPIEVQRGMNAMMREILNMLDERAVECADVEAITNVATISANNDARLGALIAEAVEAVGANGIITVEDGVVMDDHLEYTEGLEFNRGFLANQFINNPEKATVEFEKPFILLMDHKLHQVKDILGCLEHSSKSNRPMVIIAEDFAPEALQALVMNKLRGAIQISCVKAPGIGHNRNEILKDFAVSLGATVVSNQLEAAPEFNPEFMGSADKVTMTNTKTTIIQGGGTQEEVDAHVEGLKNQIAGLQHASDREMVAQRIARISGAVAIIKVGATTEVEMKEKKDRIEDALNATRAAVEEGIVAGGGQTLFRIGLTYDTLDRAEAFFNSLTSADMIAGATELLSAIKVPLITIMDNTGQGGGHLSLRVQNAIDESNDENFGYNVMTGEYGDLIEQGVIDPVKVTKSSLKYAVSVASIILTTEAGVGIIPKENVFGMDMNMLG